MAATRAYGQERPQRHISTVAGFITEPLVAAAGSGMADPSSCWGLIPVW